METVFHISNCPEVYQVKYATCTLLDSALTWWNSQKRTIRVDDAIAMTWRDLIKLKTEVYCLRNEIQKMETELMVPGEEDRIERYVGGLLDNIQGNVMSVEPTRLQDAIQLANSLMDQKLKSYAIRSAKNKRKAYTAGGNKGRVYVGPHSLCNKCKLHHVGPCTVKCRSCGKIGHLTRDCKPVVPATVNQWAPVNHGNKPVIPEARGKAYAIGRGDANPGSNVVTDVSYAVELADRRIAKTNIILRGCTIGLLGHPFNINLMPVKLGSFDVIISMDWRANNRAMIVCDEKIVCIPFGDEILIAQGDRSDKGKK
ncbi:putative reverse transcriptase domain-containing protein [Tanacetum coccineum]